MDFIKDGVTLSLFSMLTTVATPQTVVAQELRIESLFPVDEATEARHSLLMSVCTREVRGAGETLEFHRATDPYSERPFEDLSHPCRRSESWRFHGLLAGSFGVMVTKPRNTLSEPPSQYSTTSWCAVNPLSTKARRFPRNGLASVPITDTQVGCGIRRKAMNPCPVLSSISRQNANSHCGAAVFVNVTDCICVSCVDV